MPTEGNDTIFGTPGNDWIGGNGGDDALYGLAGNDTLVGFNGNDSLDGGDGNDYLLEDRGAGDDTLVGGNGDDTINDEGGNASIDAGSGNDNVGFLSFASRPIGSIYLGSGNDTLSLSGHFANNSSISIDLGTGNDSIILWRIAGSGTIAINGFTVYQDHLEIFPSYSNFGSGTAADLDGDGFADDVEVILRTTPGYSPTDADVTIYFLNSAQYLPIDGLENSESIVGSIFSDTIFGLAGNDTLRGGSSADFLYSGSGNDTVYGDLGNDLIRGDLGDDYLSGGMNDDVLHGDSGNDYLEAGAGNDTCFGGDGADTILIDFFSSSHDYIFGFDISEDSFGQIIDLQNNILMQDLDNDGFMDDARFMFGSNTISMFDISVRPWVGTQINDWRSGTPFNDTLFGDDGGDFLQGFSGSDSLVGGPGNDALWGQSGDDIIEGGPGNDGLHGSDGADIVRGGDGIDSVSGGRGSDRLSGGGGVDLFWGSAVQTGGSMFDLGPGLWSGNDTITDFDFLEDRIFSVVNRTRAQTSIDLDGDGALDDAMIEAPVSDGPPNSTESYSIVFLNFTVLQRQGTESPDILFATPFDETISGLDGNDSIFGGAGDDQINGDGGDDTIYSGSGNATIQGGLGNDLVFSQGNFAQVTGGAGDDVISGGFRGFYFGGDGNDRIGLGRGEDAAFGGLGDDTITGSLGNDFIDGGDGWDTAFLISGFNITSVSANAATGYVTVSENSIPSSVVKVENIEVWRFLGGNDIATSWIGGPVLYGGGGNDWMADYASASNAAGAGNNDWMFGEDGDDALYGLEGNDRLYGGQGRDILVGGVGSDTLSGDLGSDWIALGLNAAGTGGDGAVDIVLFGSRWDTWDPNRAGMDAIAQFETGIDRIDLSAVDANTLVAGDQAFTIGALTAGQAGRLQILSPTGATWTALLADVDGDGAADMTIFVYGATGQALVTAADIIV